VSERMCRTEGRFTVFAPFISSTATFRDLFLYVKMACRHIACVLTILNVIYAQDAILDSLDYVDTLIGNTNFGITQTVS